MDDNQASQRVLSAEQPPEPTDGPLAEPVAAPFEAAPPCPEEPQRSGELPALTRFVRALGLLTLTGLSIGFGLSLLRSPADLVSFVAQNQISDFPRQAILNGMGAGAAVAIAVGLAGLLLLAARGHPSPAGRLDEVARRLAPLALTGFLPLLFHWQLWEGRELTFLVLAAGFALAAWSSVRAALSSPPLLRALSSPAPWPWLDRLRSTLASSRSALRFVDQKWLPGALVGLGVAGYAALFSSFTVTFHRNLRTASYDLGLEDNLLWNVLHGIGFFRSTPFNGPGGTHFGNHATFFAYLLAPFYALSQSAATLLVIQSVLIALAAVPLFLFARRHLGPWPACLVALCYLLYPPVHGANLYEFHYIPLGAVFLWSALYLLEEKRDWLAAVAILIALSVREDVGAGVAIIGAYLLLTGQRPRAGLILTIVGVLHVGALKLVFMPMVARGEESFTWMYKGLLPQGKTGFGPLLKTVIGNPGFTLGTLIDRDKLVYLLQLFVPLAFLPLRRPIVLLLIVPGAFFTLLSTGYQPLIQISFQYTFHWTVFLFIGLVVALEGTRVEGDPRAATVRRRAALAALACATLVVSYQFGAIFQQHTARGGFAAYRFDTTPQDVADRATLQRLLSKLPARASVAASDNLVPQVSSRPQAYTLHFGVFDAQYILFWSARPRNWEPEQQYVIQELSSGSFGVVAVEEPFALARRGASPVLNNQLLERWGVAPMVPAGGAQQNAMPQFGR